MIKKFSDRSISSIFIRMGSVIPSWILYILILFIDLLLLYVQSRLWFCHRKIGYHSILWSFWIQKFLLNSLPPHLLFFDRNIDFGVSKQRFVNRFCIIHNALALFTAKHVKLQNEWTTYAFYKFKSGILGFFDKDVKMMVMRSNVEIDRKSYRHLS